MKLTQQRFEFSLASLGIQILAGLQNGHDVIGHCQLAKDRGFLWQIADAFARASVHGQRGDSFVVDSYFALIRFDQAYDHIEAGRFASPVGPQQANDFSATDRDGDVFDNVTCFVGLGQVTGC